MHHSGAFTARALVTSSSFNTAQRVAGATARVHPQPCSHLEKHRTQLPLDFTTGQRATGATVYVTLEPCNHFGRTPPCALALVDAGVSRVGFSSQIADSAGQASNLNPIRRA